MVSALELVSLSDFVLSALCLFLSGLLFGKVKSHLSTYAMLCYFFLFAGLSAFMGGIDHGFFEPIDQRYYPRTFTYLFVALLQFIPSFEYTNTFEELTTATLPPATNNVPFHPTEYPDVILGLVIPLFQIIPSVE